MAQNDGLKNIQTDILINVLSITDAIISYASNNSTDLIVMGIKGRTGIDRFLLGSVASGVVKHSHCSKYLLSDNQSKKNELKNHLGKNVNSDSNDKKRDQTN